MCLNWAALWLAVQETNDVQEQFDKYKEQMQELGDADAGLVVWYRGGVAPI